METMNPTTPDSEEEVDSAAAFNRTTLRESGSMSPLPPLERCKTHRDTLDTGTKEENDAPTSGDILQNEDYVVAWIRPLSVDLAAGEVHEPAESSRQRLPPTSEREAAQQLVEHIDQQHGYVRPATVDKLGIPSQEVRRKIKNALLKQEELVGASIITLARNLYSSNVRFVFELLQNADDNRFTQAKQKNELPYVSFDLHLHQHRIIVECNEDGFTKANVEAISNIGMSSKSNAQGIGFKSVFKVAYKVLIQSGAFTFSFTHMKGDSGMGMICPDWDSDVPFLESGVTRMTLFLHEDDQPSSQAGIRSQFQDLQVEMLLFLRNLKKIEVRNFDEADQFEWMTTYVASSISESRKQTEVTTLNGENVSSCQTYYHVTKHTAINLLQSGTRDDSRAEIILAFPLSKDLVPIQENQSIFAFLPVCDVGFKFIVHAHFETTANRQDIETSAPRNGELIENIADAFAKGVTQLCTHETLQYQWMRYVPEASSVSRGPYWSQVVTSIISRLQTLPVLRPASLGPLRMMMDLQQHTSDALDNDKKPLLADIVRELHLSPGYTSADLATLADLIGIRANASSPIEDYLSSGRSSGPRHSILSREQLPPDSVSSAMSTSAPPQGTDCVESIRSNQSDIGSSASIGRSRVEFQGISVLARYFTHVEELAPLQKQALQRMGRARFVNNYRRILKYYYMELKSQVMSEKEGMAAKLLKKRTNRTYIGRTITNIMMEEQQELLQESSKRIEDSQIQKKDINAWLTKLSAGGEPPATENAADQYDSDDSDDDDSNSDGEERPFGDSKEDLVFSEIEQIEMFLRHGSAFSTLVAELLLLQLPGHLRDMIQTVPKAWIHLNPNNDYSALNRVQLSLEYYTIYSWDWWPLRPPVRDIESNYRRLEWKFHGRYFQSEVSEELANIIVRVLDLLGPHPRRCHCCLKGPSVKSRTVALSRLLVWSKLILMSVWGLIQAVSGVSLNTTQNYSPPTYSSAHNSGRIELRELTTVDDRQVQDGGISGSSLGPQINSIAAQEREVPWVIFAVKGRRWSLEIKCFFVPAEAYDSNFFKMFRNYHRSHRSKLSHWLSPFRFLNCKFVKFEKLGAERVISTEQHALPDDYPEYLSQYEYRPRPPVAKLPLISSEIFQVLLNECNDKCVWQVLPWHDCIVLEPTSFYLDRIPKKKGRFDLSNKGEEKVAFGIEADYVLSFAALAAYHLLAIIPSFGFWVVWLLYHKDDWQNASVPMLTILALITVFWTTMSKRIGLS